MKKNHYKQMDGISYYSNRIVDYYRLWESITHPKLKHWTKIKTNENK